MKELGGGANKRLGQHFLIDRAALKDVVDAAPCHPGAVTLEVGPGLGVLTKELLAKGCDVVALERDRRFVGYLEKNHEHENLRIVQGDAAELDWMKIVGDAEWSLVSNLPYSISSLALRLALWSPRPAEHVVVLVQREVAQRAVSTAPNGKTSLLSLMVALASDSTRIIRRVPAGAFYPPPKVESAILEIVPMPLPERKKKWGMDPEQIMRIAKAGFAHPRKKLLSNLCESDRYSKQAVERTFGTLGISENSRAEDISPETWTSLAKELEKTGESSLDSISGMV